MRYTYVQLIIRLRHSDCNFTRCIKPNIHAPKTSIQFFARSPLFPVFSAVVGFRGGVWPSSPWRDGLTPRTSVAITTAADGQPSFTGVLWENFRIPSAFY